MNQTASITGAAGGIGYEMNSKEIKVERRRPSRYYLVQIVCEPVLFIGREKFDGELAERPNATAC